MGTLIITRGLPHSGRTEWAKDTATQRNGIHIDVAEIRLTRTGKTHGITSEQNTDITAHVLDIVENALCDDALVIVDDAHLSPFKVKQWSKIADKHAAAFSVSEFWTPVQDCIDGDAASDHPLGADILRDMDARYKKNAAIFA